MTCDQRGILAAHLQDDRARVSAICKCAVDSHADVEGAGKRDAVDQWAVHERFSQRTAGAGHVVKRAVRQPGVPETFRQQTHGPRGIGGGFHHDGVSRHQRRAGGSAGQGRWKIEGTDDHPDTIGSKHRDVSRLILLERIFAHAHHEAVV